MHPRLHPLPTSALLAWFLTATGVVADIQATLNPAVVTAADELKIDVVLPSAHLNSCYFTTPEFSRAGDQLTITLTTSTEDGICAQVISDAQVQVPVGKLEPGTYNLTIIHNTTVGGRLRELERTSFAFLVFPAARPALSNTLEIQFETLSGWTYQVKGSTNLQSWTNVGSAVIGDGTPAAIPTPAGGATRFFRLEISATE